MFRWLSHFWSICATFPGRLDEVCIHCIRSWHGSRSGAQSNSTSESCLSRTYCVCVCIGVHMCAYVCRKLDIAGAT